MPYFLTRNVLCHKQMRRFTPFLALALASLILTGPADAEDWPVYRGDNARTGATDSEVSLPLTALWSSRAPAVPRLAWSSGEGRVIEGKLLGHRIRFDDAFRPVISAGRVYFGSTVDHQVYCLDLQSGETLWTFYTGGPVRLAPTLTEKSVLFGSDDGRVYCLDKTNGTLRWEHRVAPEDEWLLARGEMISKWPVRTGVLVQKGVAYFGSGIFPHETVYLEGVDVETGKSVWRADNISAQDGGRDDLSPQGYLLATDKVLFVPSGGSLPAAFDLETGEMLHKRTHSWRSTAGGVVGGTRALLADGQIYTGGTLHYLAMDERKGDVGFAWVEGREMTVQGDEAYIVTGEKLARLDRIPYAENSRVRQALEIDIYTASRERSGADEKKKAELDKRTADAQEQLAQIAGIGIDWEVPTGDDMALLVSGSHVFLGGPGRITAYRKDTGEKVWEGVVDGEARSLAIAGGRLLVSTDSGLITCFAPEAASGGSSPVERVQGAGTPAGSDPVYEQAAREILSNSGVHRGFCLLLGSDKGELALELARQSDLKIYCVEPDPEKAARSRERLQQAGFYGHRVTVHEWESAAAIPYSNYFANLIVSEEMALTGASSPWIEQVSRHLKPDGGVVYLGRPQGTEGFSPDQLATVVKTMELAGQSDHHVRDGVALLTRGRLPGAGNWSHQYGNPDNTAVSRDTRVKGDLGVLWYGDPGPDQMVNRHEGAVGPLSVDGRLFVQGQWSIMAYDAYNGVHLWTQENPEAIRTGVFQNQNPGNLAVGEGALFHFHGDKCYQHDQDTGALVATHTLPPEVAAGDHLWGYVAVEDGILFGTATIRKEIEEQKRRRGKATDESTDALFAIDVKSGDLLWSYEGKSVSHHTIAIGDGKVCFIDSSLTSEQREERLRQDKSKLAALSGEQKELAEARAKIADLRMAVALDARSGEKLWDAAVDVTDCSDIGIGGGKLTMMYSDGKLVLCGANANGHYWSQFMEGEFKRRRIAVLSAEDGYQIWARDANYLHRPIVIAGQILAEPWMYDLETGDQITRSHPVTGNAEPWSMMRTGHHCGMVTGSDSGMLLFRSGFTAFADLNEDEGIRHFSGHRTGCWINAISANGLVMIPEAAVGCVCQFSLESTIVLEPRAPRRPWSVYSAVGDLLPVKHLAVNLGAPGDRKDDSGQLWLSYPRYTPYKKTSLEVVLDLNPRFSSAGEEAVLARTSTHASGGISAKGFANVSEESAPAVLAETPWLYLSWAEGLKGLTLPLTNSGGEPVLYTVRLHFADLHSATSAETDFQVSASSGENALRSVPVRLVRAEGEPDRPTVVELKDLSVTGTLDLEFSAPAGVSLSAIEAIRQ